MRGVIPWCGLVWEEDHGRPITCCGERGAKARAAHAQPVTRARRGGPGSGPSADPGGFDQPQDCRGLRGPRGYGPPLAQRFHEGRGRGAAPIPRAGAGADQGRARSGGGRGASVRARGGPSELDAAALGRRDREALRGSRLVVAAVRGAAPKGDFGWRRARHTLKGRQDADAMDRAGLRRKLLKAQAEAGDIVLLFGDESEALTHPYLAHVWAKKGADLRVPAPGQSTKVAMLGVLDWARRKLIVRPSRTKRSADFIALLEEVDRRYGPTLGVVLKPIEPYAGRFAGCAQPSQPRSSPRPRPLRTPPPPPPCGRRSPAPPSPRA